MSNSHLRCRRLAALALLLICHCTTSFAQQSSPDALLLSAIEKNNLNMVKILIAKRASVDAPDENGETPLMLAAKYGATKICEFLLEKGASIETADKSGFTAIFSAAGFHQQEVVRLLLDRGAKTQIKGITVDDSVSLMHTAANAGDVEILKMLLSRGLKADDRSDEKSSTALMFAVIAKFSPATKLLLEKGADVNASRGDGATPLILAVMNKNEEAIPLLLQKGADPNHKDEYGKSPLQYAQEIDFLKGAVLLKAVGAKVFPPTVIEAVKQGNAKLLRQLFLNGADANLRDSRGKTALFYCATGFDTEMMKTLLENGANPNAKDEKGSTPIMLAKAANSYDSVAALVSAGAYAPELDMIDAVSAKNTNAVKKMLAQKVSPDSVGLSKRSALSVAVGSGDFEMVKLLVDAGAHPNVLDDEGKTPLSYAVFSENRMLIDYLLLHGADVKLMNIDGENVLMDLGANADLSLVKTLVEKGANVHAKSIRSGRTVLISIVASCEEPIVQYLLDNGAQSDVNLQDEYGKTPLFEAASNNNEGVVKLLIAKGANVNALETNSGESPLHAALIKRRNAPRPAEAKETVRLLLAAGAKVNATDSQGKTPIQYAEPATDFEIIAMLKKAGAIMQKPEIKSELCDAVSYNDVEQTKRLLAIGENPNVMDKINYSPLMTASIRGQLEIVRLLLAYGAKPDFRVKEVGVYCQTALMLAAGEGHVPIVRLLLKNGADPKAKSLDETALLNAAKRGRTEICKLLLDAGADIHDGESRGLSPLVWSCSLLGDEKTTRLLISRGARVNTKDSAGMTPLLTAVENGMLENVVALLENKANLNDTTNDGTTALILAVYSGKTNLVQFLLKKGVDVNARDSKKTTALTYALNRQVPEIVAILKEKGAKE